MGINFCLDEKVDLAPISCSSNIIKIKWRGVEEKFEAQQMMG
jgi:hypothetical protein